MKRVSLDAPWKPSLSMIASISARSEATSCRPMAWIWSGVRSSVVYLRICSRYQACPSGIASAASVARAFGVYSVRKNTSSFANAGITASRIAARPSARNASCSAAGIVAGILRYGPQNEASSGFFRSATIAMEPSRPSSTARGTLKPRARPARMLATCWSK